MRARLPLLWLTIALLGACGGEATAEGGPPPPTPVEVTHGRVGALSITRTYLGTVRSVARAQVAAEAAGEVLEVTVREGDRVEAGQLLVRIDADLARADMAAARADAEQAQAQQTQARAEATRFSRAGASTVAQLEIERAAAQAEALSAAQRGRRAQVARARSALDRTRVVAPFAGVIAARHVDPGDWVTAGAPTLELVADDASEVLVRVEPDLLDDVDVGSEATLLRAEATQSARVVGVVRALDPATRTAQLRLTPDAATTWLYAGSAIDVRFVLEHEGEGLVISRDALIPGVARARVVTVVDEQALAVPVEVLERTETEVRVQGEGLSPESVLVTRGSDRLRDGTAVRIVEP